MADDLESPRRYGPIITAIDAGHFERTGDHKLKGKCGVCLTVWPCDTMVLAKKDQKAYADELARNARHDKALADSKTVRPLFGGYGRG